MNELVKQSKTCIYCKIEKTLDKFPKRLIGSLDGHRNECYDCKNDRHRKYRKTRYEHLYKYHLEYGRKHRAKNQQKYREYVKNYRIKYPEKRREYDRKHRENPSFRIKTNLRCRLREILRKQGAVKSNRTVNLIGCSIEYLMQYLQSLFYHNKVGLPMTLELLSTPQIELDHIIPLWKFNLTNSEEQKRAFHYTNMRPMWAKDHNIKSAKDYSEYCEWKRSGLNLNDFLQKLKNGVI